MKRNTTRATACEAQEWADPSPRSPLWGEHRSRYHFAAQFVSERIVVDVACGSGFGASILLAAGAAAVLGVDASSGALERASEQAPSGCELCQADGMRLPLANNSVGVVTSFETLEHVEDPDRFVSELRRALNPTGVLILSSPNALYTKPVDGKPANPFHVREFTPSELEALLRPRFGQVRLLGQVPHPRFKACPYWTLPEHLPTDPVGRLRVLSWKLQSRLPGGLKEGLAKARHGRGFYPGEHDFVFTEEALDGGHVQLAVCRP